MKELLEAGVHFGHQTRRWNPKMKRFIFTERGGIYIIALQQTQQLVEDAYAFARNIAERGGTILFVGTKKQAQDAVKTEAERVGMPYVANRWLGGLLSNWRTISDRSEIVRQLVSRPPSQRFATYGIPTRSASVLTASCACFFVPTKRIVPPRSAILRAKAYASSTSCCVCCRAM